MKFFIFFLIFLGLIFSQNLDNSTSTNENLTNASINVSTNESSGSFNQPEQNFSNLTANNTTANDTINNTVNETENTNSNSIFNLSVNQTQTTNQSENLTAIKNESSVNESSALVEKIFSHKSTRQNFEPSFSKNVRNILNILFFYYSPYLADTSSYYKTIFLNQKNDFYFSLWFKSNFEQGEENYEHTLWSYFQPSNSLSLSTSLSNKNLIFRLSDGSQEITQEFTLNTSQTTKDEYHNLVFVKEGKQIKLFFDGKKLLEENSKNIFNSLSWGWLSIGSTSCESQYFFPCFQFVGSIKNITYCYSPLSDEEIAYEFNITKKSN